MRKRSETGQNPTIQKNAKDSMQAQVESFLLEPDRVRRLAGRRPDPVRKGAGRGAGCEPDHGPERRPGADGARACSSVPSAREHSSDARPAPGPARAHRRGRSATWSARKSHSARPIAAEAFYFDVFLGLEEETARSGRHTLFTYLDDYDPEDLETFRAFLAKVDGVIVEEARNPILLETARSSGVPTVLLAPTNAIEGLDLVTMDLAAGAKKAVRCLRDLGHERIAIVNGPLRLESARIRFLAWKEAMAETGALADERLVDGDEGWSAEAGAAAMARLLERCPDLTAVFCANDLLAIGALSALAERSLPRAGRRERHRVRRHGARAALLPAAHDHADPFEGHGPVRGAPPAGARREPGPSRGADRVSH